MSGPYGVRLRTVGAVQAIATVHFIELVQQRRVTLAQLLVVCLHGHPALMVLLALRQPHGDGSMVGG